MTPKDHDQEDADLITGDYLVRFEARTLDDIRALGGNDEEDDRKFAAAARVSEINLGLYRTFFQPWVRLWANEGVAQSMRRLHPLRVQYEIFSRSNPFMRPLLSALEQVQENRAPVSKDNALWQAQTLVSDWIEASLNAYRDVRDHMAEASFHAIYGSPLLQALVGLKTSPKQRPGKDAAHLALVAKRIEELKQAIPQGGPREAVIRALLYVRMPEGVVDERGFNLMRRMREEAGKGLSLAAFKKLVREQFFMLLLDERRAVEAIPAMLAKDASLAGRMIGELHELIDMVGLRSNVAKARLTEIEAIFKRSGRRMAPSIANREKTHSGTVRQMRPHATRSLAAKVERLQSKRRQAVDEERHRRDAAVAEPQRDAALAEVKRQHEEDEFEAHLSRSRADGHTEKPKSKTNG